ncbi:MAG: hypothetical protein ABI114_01490 [Rhodanobacter sp.]
MLIPLLVMALIGKNFNRLKSPTSVNIRSVDQLSMTRIVVTLLLR